MQVTLKSKRLSKTINIEKNENVLFAGLRQGLKLPYSCASGTCGTCQAKIVGGKFLDAWPSAAAKKFIPDGSGRLLMCQALCESNAELRMIGPFGINPDNVIVPDYCDGTLVSKKLLTEDVLTFSISSLRDFRYKAGQFAMLQIPGITGWRAYSMSNLSTPNEYTEFLIRKVPGGKVSDWIFNEANLGDKVRIFGPLGSAILQPDEGDENVCCICGGSGIAGIIAMMEDACAKGHLTKNKMQVFFGLRSEADNFFLDRLSELVVKANGALSVTVVYSEHKSLEEIQTNFPGIKVKFGLVHEVAFQSIAEVEPNKDTWFLAGPPIVVDLSEEELLQKLNVCSSKIRLDRFG